MLLSSVNFVNKARAEKHFRREKDRDILKEKSEDLTYCKKYAEKASKSKKFVKAKAGSEEVSDTTVQADVSSPRTSGYGSSASVTSYDISLNSPTSSTDRVSITTVDEYNLFIDPSFYFVTLCKQKQITKCSSFTRHIIQTRTHENGNKEHTVQFCLTCEPDFFLTTDIHRQLELKLFEDDTMTSDEDERLFTIFESATGQSFIQPTNHKGYYLHHLDDKLSVRKLELNLRAPEEYVFHVHSHGNTNLQLHQNGDSSSKQFIRNQTTGATSKHSDKISTGKKQYDENCIQNNSCMFQSHSVCTCIHKCDKSHKEVRTDKLSSLNSNVIKLCAPARTFNDHAISREVATAKAGTETKKSVQVKRNSSFYNVVSMTGSCFGFGKKPED